MQQLIIEVDSNSAIVVRYSGGFRTTHKRVTTALKHAAKHVAAYPANFGPNPIVITASAAALLAQE